MSTENQDKKTQWLPIGFAAIVILIALFFMLKNGNGLSSISWGPGFGQEPVKVWVDFPSLQQAQSNAGFEMQFPESLKDQYPAVSYHSLLDTMIEVQFKNADNKTVLAIRKGVGDDDISYDEKTYQKIEIIDVEGKSVTIKGNEGKVSSANWVDGDYTYAISAQPQPLNEEDARNLVMNIK